MNLLNQTNILNSQLNHCKTVVHSCEFFNYFSYISEEEPLVSKTCVIYPSQGSSHILGRFIYIINNDDIYTKVPSTYFCNLKTRVKHHLLKRSSPKNECDWHKKQNNKGKCETCDSGISMRITRLRYAGCLIGLSKINFEQEISKFVLKGLDVGDINHTSKLYSKLMLFISQQVTE